MAISDFLKTWKVYSRKHAPGVYPGHSTLCIYPDLPDAGLMQERIIKGGMIIIHHRNFGARYPTYLNAVYDEPSDSIFATISKGQTIKLKIHRGKMIATLPNIGWLRRLFKTSRWRARTQN